MTTVEDRGTSERTELDILDPNPAAITLPVAGIDVIVQPLKTRQLFRLLKIVTRGAGKMLRDLDLATDDTDKFVAQLLGLMIASVPEAEDEALDFIKSMVLPASYVEGRKLPKDVQAKNATAINELDDVLYNPDLEDTLTIVETIIKIEGKDIQRLGKRLGQALNLAEKSGMLPETTTTISSSLASTDFDTPPNPSSSDSTRTDYSEGSVEPLI